LNELIESIAARLLPDEAALITGAHTRRYLTGIRCDDGCLLITQKEAIYFTDSRYIEAVKQAAHGLACRMYNRMTDSLNEAFREFHIKQVLLEASETTVAAMTRFRDRLSATPAANDRLDDWLSALRAVKTPEQIKKIKAAQALTEFGFRFILEKIAPGQTERDIALTLEFAIRKKGAEAVAFDFIAVSGENTSLPHGVPGNRRLQKGDFLTLDFGAMLDGWHSDMTRTVAVGGVSDEQRKIYDTVLEAQRACLAVLRPGITGAEGDKASRSVIEDAGYGEYFGHGTGHGVGIQIHEEPRLSPACKEMLQPGNVVTVEPGIYLPGKFGVRIEDMVAVTEDGVENLTAATKELIIL